MMHEFNWRNRKTTLAALLITLLVFVILEYLAQADASLLEKYGLSQSGIQLYYSLLIGALAVLVVVEPKLRPFLREHRAGLVVIPLAAVVSFLIVWLVGENQETRLFQFPFSLWLVITHTVGLCVLAVILVTPNPLASISPRLTIIALVFTSLLLVALIVVHIISISAFMRIDTPDEPWTGSLATNFAENGDLSPSYLASTYGSPDIVFPRGYYLAMGFWLRLIPSTSLAALRAFPLLVGGLSVGLLALALWRTRYFTPLQIMVSAVTLLGLSTFVRTAHNVRMDIALALYSVLALWALLEFFHGDTPRRWPMILLGLTLLVGMESVPTVALPYALSVGIVLLIWVARKKRPSALQYPVLYAFICLAAVVTYFVLQFLPDIQSSLERYRQFASFYLGANQLGSIRFPFPALRDVIIRFNLSLSPLELLVSIGALLLLWRSGKTSDRLIALIPLLTLTLIFLFSHLAYGYMVIHAPIIAYAVGRAIRLRAAVVGGVFILIPALVSAPLFDLVRATQADVNQRMFDDDRLMLDAIPEGTTLIADDRLWFTLYPERTFIGWNGLTTFIRVNQTDLRETLTTLGIEAVICSQEYASRCERFKDLDMFQPPVEYETPDETYSVYWRTP